MFATALTEDEVSQLLSSPPLSEQVGTLVGAGIEVRALGNRGDTFAVAGSEGEFVVRFPRDESSLSALRREERLHKGLRSVAPLRIPDTRVVAASDEHPVFAIHRMIPGEQLTGHRYAGLSCQARSRLVTDLVEFLLALHNVPLPVACE